MCANGLVWIVSMWCACVRGVVALVAPSTPVRLRHPSAGVRPFRVPRRWLCEHEWEVGWWSLQRVCVLVCLVGVWVGLVFSDCCSWACVAIEE